METLQSFSSTDAEQSRISHHQSRTELKDESVSLAFNKNIVALSMEEIDQYIRCKRIRCIQHTAKERSSTVPSTRMGSSPPQVLAEKVYCQSELQTSSLGSFQSFRAEHRSMVIAVFEVGLSTATPKLLQENISLHMKEKYPDISDLARIKSRLQYCRKKMDIAVDEFAKVYDSTLNLLFKALRDRLRNKNTDLRYSTERSMINLRHWSLMDPVDLINQLPQISGSFSSGENAAYCTFRMLPFFTPTILRQLTVLLRAKITTHLFQRFHKESEKSMMVIPLTKRPVTGKKHHPKETWTKIISPVVVSTYVSNCQCYQK